MQPAQPPSLCRMVIYTTGNGPRAAMIIGFGDGADPSAAHLAVFTNPALDVLTSSPIMTKTNIPYDSAGSVGSWAYPPVVPPRAG